MEVWKDAPGMGGLLKVSNKGRCLSVGRWTRTMLGVDYYKEPTLIGGGDGKSYIHVSAKVDGKTKRAPLHRLVALAFIPNPDNKPVVNHIDGNKRNNAVDNLEWVTYAENAQHAYRTGLNSREKIIAGQKRAKEESVAWWLPSEEPVEEEEVVEEVIEATEEPPVDTGTFEDAAREYMYYVPHHGWTRVVSYEV